MTCDSLSGGAGRKNENALILQPLRHANEFCVHILSLGHFSSQLAAIYAKKSKTHVLHKSHKRREICH